MAKRHRTEATRRETEEQDAPARSDPRCRPRDPALPCEAGPGHLEAAAPPAPSARRFGCRAPGQSRGGDRRGEAALALGSDAINEGLDPRRWPGAYERGGASGDFGADRRARYFGGAIADLEAVVAAIECPVLRKDFILEEVQLLEARASGAAAALLIVRVLDRYKSAPPDAVRRRAGPCHACRDAHRRRNSIGPSPRGRGSSGSTARNLDTFAIDTAGAWALHFPRFPPDRHRRGRERDGCRDRCSSRGRMPVPMRCSSGRRSRPRPANLRRPSGRLRACRVIGR